MNNRKQSNKRGRNPRGYFKQVIVESATIKRKKGETTIDLPNSRFGQTTSIIHRNF